MCHILYFKNIKKAADVYVVTYVETCWLHCPLKQEQLHFYPQTLLRIPWVNQAIRQSMGEQCMAYQYDQHHFHSITE